MLLKELTALRGVSGGEGEVRSFIVDQAAPWCDEIKVDNMGSVIAWKHSKTEGAPTVMIDAHMDEVGFLVQYIRDDGMIRYLPVGGVDAAVCVSKRVRIGKNAVPGVIGCKAVHLQEAGERSQALKHSQLLIDIGAKDKKDALTKVKVGDYITFDSDFVEFGEGLVKSRALDDRVGCAVMLELMKHEYPCNVAFCFTVQEEIGLRGAKAAAFRVQPDCALALEGTTANDTTGARAHEEICSLHKGPSISFMDKSQIVNPALFDRMRALAKEKNIPWQLKRGVAGGNDAGSIQRAACGCATVTLSVPCRYIHSPSSVCATEDVENLYRLVKAFLDEGGKFGC